MNKLNIKEKALLSLIEMLAKEDGYCLASNSTLSTEVNIHERTLYRILNRLEELHYIYRVTQSIGNYGKERRIYLNK